MNQRTRIKICGMNDPTLVDDLVRLGVDAIGLVFVSSSPFGTSSRSGAGSMTASTNASSTRVASSESARREGSGAGFGICLLREGDEVVGEEGRAVRS